MLDVFTKVVLAGACLFTFAWVVLAQRRTVRRLSDACLRLTHFQRAVVLLAVIVCTVYAQKPSTNDVEGVTGTNLVEVVDGGGTNQVGGIVLNAPQPMSNGVSFFGGCGALGTVRPTVAVRPYRLESVSTNEGYSYAMPVGGTIRGTWHLTGAYEDVQRVALDGFVFPLGSDLCTSLWAYTWGKVRPQLRNASNEIAAVGAPMSAIPDVSRFWAAATSNDTYLLTWENFAAGRLPAPATRDASGTVNAQVELFRNGDFITRSNDVECVYHRVNPDDWDDDGIPNEDDPEPLYRAEDETHFGPHQNLSVIINSNAYCWVDVVVPQVNARVMFVGDGHCRLPDPSFIAEAGATNRVVILIGKEYHVFCDMPFEIVGKSDPEIEVWANASTDKTICWPLTVEAWEGNGNSFRMHVVPNRVGGGFTWTNVCCSISGSGYAFSYGCDKDCLCTGCATSGFLEYEEFRKGCTGGSCGCSSWGEWVEDGDPDEAPEPASVSVDFSKSVVLFEEAYTNSYGQPVRGQSTVTRLTCVAYGGEHGGDLTFTLSGVDKLTRIAGAELPTGSISVEPYQTRTYKVDYHGKEPSEGKGDITVSALLVENDTSENHSDEDALTSVRVSTYVYCAWIPWRSRKEVGVGEEVIVIAEPDEHELDLTFQGCVSNRGQMIYHAPFEGSVDTVIVESGDVSLPLVFTVEEPELVLAVDCYTNATVGSGKAGGITCNYDLRLMPTNVSFSAVETAELPRVSTDPIGYFAQPKFSYLLDHGQHGGGVWHGFLSQNRFNDRASISELPQDWMGGGSFTYPIPRAWRPKGDASVTNEVSHQKSYDQRIELDGDGTTRIIKFSYRTERMTNGVMTLTRSL